MMKTFFFWLHHGACESLVLQPGIEPLPLVVEVNSLNHCNTIYLYFG